jgi:hypothetical protein
MALEDMKKTTLITKTIMAFGLKNVTNIFTRTMLEVFKDLRSIFQKVFVDDLNVHNESWKEHLQHLDVVFYKLKEVNLKLNPNKCCFATENITFLGHVVSKEGTRLDLDKIEGVLHFPEPKMVTNVRSFLGLTRYYRNYIQGYSRLVTPLFESTKKNVDFIWDVGYQQAFRVLKVALVDAPVLIQPNFKRPFCLDVDWSPKGVGAILSTNSDEEEKCWTDTRNSDIWKDVMCMKLLQEGTILDTIDLEECKRSRKRILNYH